MTRLPLPSTMTAPLVLSLFCLCPLWAGCGDEADDFSVQDKPAVALSTGSIEIVLPDRENVAKTVDTVLSIQSIGKVDLTVQEIKWLGEKPSRVFMGRGSREGVEKAACTSEVYFIASKLCIETGAPDTPLQVAEETQIPLYISAFGDSEVNAITCPAEVPSSVPDQYKARYCGALQIVTDGVNDLEGTVSQGVATVYFQADRTQGNLVYSKPSIGYENVKPGYDEVQTFSITNNSDEPVTVTQIFPTGAEAVFAIEDLDPLPLTLKTNATEPFSIRLKVPISYTKADLDQIAATPGLAIRIISSAPGSPKDIPIAIDTNLSVPSIPQLEKERLEFAGDMDVQEFTITNPGSQTLRITGLRFEPDVRAAYDIFFDDNGTEKSLQSTPLLISSFQEGEPERNKRTVKVRYKAPVQGPALTSVFLTYAYAVGNLEERGEARIVLMGDQKNVPFGTLSSNSLVFSTTLTGMDQISRVLLTNQGTAPLNVTGVQISSLNPTAPIEEVSLLVDGAAAETFTVAPGASKEMRVRFTRANNDNDQITIKFDSDTAGPPLSLQVNSLGADLPADPFAFTSSFSAETMPGDQSDEVVFTNAATTGTLTTLEFTPAVDANITSSASWILVQKPEGSALVIDTRGPKVGFIPDKPGVYQVLVNTTLKDFSLQKLVEFRVEDPAL